MEDLHWIDSETQALLDSLVDGLPTARILLLVSPGHSLIIPLRHCADFFELSPEEMAPCMDLLVSARADLDAELKPDGYNIGVNIGQAGGQSIRRVHVHLIPRYAGDHPRPQGGVRHIIPWRAEYPRAGAAPPG